LNARQELRPQRLKQASLARRSRARALDPDRLAPRPSSDPSETAAARELADALTIALARLGPQDREVLVPLLLDGRRAVEIARELGRRADTIHMRIHRGLARLRRLLPAGMAVAGLARLGRSRSLARMRADVLRHARIELGLPGAGALTFSFAGIAMSTKTTGLALAALALCLAGAGHWQAARARRIEPTSAAPGVDRRQHAGARPVPSASSEAGAVRTPVPEPFSSPAAQASHLEIELLRAEGVPAQGALAALVDGGGHVQPSKADERGLCTFSSGTGTGDLFVRDEGRLPHHASIDLAAGRCRVELSPGRELSGRIAMASGAALPALELELVADRAPQGFEGATLEVYAALELLRHGAPRLVACATVASDGSFAVHGLTPDWSGSLELPRELVLVVDGKPTSSSAHVVSAPATGLSVWLAYRPRIVGRLVDGPGGPPVPGGTFDGAITWSDGGSMAIGASIDVRGLFSIPLDGRTDAVRLELQRVRASDGRLARAATAQEWNGPCEPFDAGDIECVFLPARPLAFRAVDPEGRPVPGARARIRELELVVAGDDGVGEFAAAPLDAESMDVAAPGHSITRVALSARTAAPIEVVLPPTNRLTVVLPPAALARRDLSLRLVSRALLFGGRSRMYDTSLRSPTIGRCLSADGDSREGSVRFGFDEQGRVEVEGIAIETPFRIQVWGSTPQGDPLVEIPIDSLGATEQRRVEVPSEPLAAGRFVAGRAVDEAGRPLHGALVGVQIAQDSYGQRTGLDGTFRVDVGGRATTDLEVAKRGFVPFRARAWPTAGDSTIEACLRRGQDLRVELVDPKGRAIEGARLRAEVEGFGPPWRVEDGPGGSFTLCDLPEGVVGVTVEVAGTSYLRSFDARSGAVRFELPEHGRLEVTWSFPGEEQREKDYRLRLQPIGPGGVEQHAWLPYAARVERHGIPSVLPGRYSVRLEVGTYSDPDADARYEPLLPPVEVLVTPGDTRVVELVR
jgi:hypothetical protein